LYRRHPEDPLRSAALPSFRTPSAARRDRVSPGDPDLRTIKPVVELTYNSMICRGSSAIRERLAGGEEVMDGFFPVGALLREAFGEAAHVGAPLRRQRRSAIGDSGSTTPSTRRLHHHTNLRDRMAWCEFDVFDSMRLLVVGGHDPHRSWAFVS